MVYGFEAFIIINFHCMCMCLCVCCVFTDLCVVSSSIIQHPFIQPVLEIYYHTKTSKLLSIHPLCPKGSLRDIIYQVIR